MDDDKIELRDCPFCGGKVRFSYDLDGMPNYIVCRACHMYVKYSNIEVKRNARFGEAMAKMAERWNRRIGNEGTL